MGDSMCCDIVTVFLKLSKFCIKLSYGINFVVGLIAIESLEVKEIELS